MMKFSEFVSIGHPDKIADYISQYLLDRYIEQDPNTRYAVEVQIKDNIVTLGGEVSSKVSFSDEEIGAFVSAAVDEIGYTEEYMKKWGLANTICGSRLETEVLLSQQSPDIAQGLSGWGDQGIFFGFASPDESMGYMPEDHTLAKRLCKDLFESGLGGLDVKTQVVIRDEEIAKVIVAIPLLDHEDKHAVEVFTRNAIAGNYELIVNGTGTYVRHSSVADCGTTGRKLAVDFYGGNCLIGGGSPWTKDASKADLTLNLFARKLALINAHRHQVPVFVSLACCIGQKAVDYTVSSPNVGVLEEGVMNIDPAVLRVEYGLDKPIYASMCRWGLFGEFQKDKAWENC